MCCISMWQNRCVLCKKQMVKNNSFDGGIVKFYQTQVPGVGDCCSKTIIILSHASKRHLGRIHIICFLVLKETFVTILTLVANFFSWCFDQLKTIKFKDQPSTINPTVIRNPSLNKYLQKMQKQSTWHAIISLSLV